MKTLFRTVDMSCALTSPTIYSSLAAVVVGGLLGTVIVSLVIFVLLRRQQIKRKRTVRRLLQEKEVREDGGNFLIKCTVHQHLNPVYILVILLEGTKCI